jgi:hypothetical protein
VQDTVEETVEETVADTAAAEIVEVEGPETEVK